MIRTRRDASAMNRCAGASGSTPWIRSSVDRSTREVSDVTMMVTMNQDAILMPSGRSWMLSRVV